MNRFEKVITQIQQAIADEKNLEERVDDLSSIAAGIEPEQAPELARITLFHSDIIRARVEKSRRFWVRLSAILAIAFVTCVSVVILLKFICW